MVLRSPSKRGAAGQKTNSIVDTWDTKIGGEELVALSSKSFIPATPKKQRIAAPTTPVATPSRSSRSQGLINRVQHSSFLRTYPSYQNKAPQVFSIGDQVIVGPEAAPSGRAWLHSVPRSHKKQRKLAETCDGEDETEEQPWSHLDGLGVNEKVAIIIALWEDERGDKWAKVRWFARPAMMWGETGPPDWAPSDYEPYEICYVHDSEWCAAKGLLDKLLAQGKRLNPDSMTGSEFAECSKAISTTPHCEDSFRISGILERVVVKDPKDYPSASAGNGTKIEDQPRWGEEGLRVFRCRRVYDSRPQSWDHYGFIKDFSYSSVYSHGMSKADWHLAVEERDPDEAEIEEEGRRKKREEIKARNKRKREEQSKGGRKKAKIVFVDEAGRMSSSESEEDDADEFLEDEADTPPDAASEEISDEYDSDDSTFRVAVLSPSNSKSKGKQSRKRKAAPQPRMTTAQKSKRQALQQRKQARLAARAAGTVATPSRLRLPLASAQQSAANAVAMMDPFARARAILHVSATPDWLPCREEEFAEVEAYLEDAIDEGSGSCIYIAGTPGTGKTATVHSVISNLKVRAKAGEISPFKFFEINGMKVTEPKQAFVLLWEFLSGGEKTSPRQALSSLETYFSSPSASRETTVVLVDELDQLNTKKQEIIYNFFNWPNQPHSRLIVLAVANQMDMPERHLLSKVRSRLGHNRINFPAYTAEQLETICQSRLEDLPGVFGSDAVRLVSKRVGRVVGDARKALDVCRRAVEVVEARNAERKARGEPPLTVTVQDCSDVYNEMVGSGLLLVVRSMSVHQQVMLLAISRVSKSLGVPEVELGEVMKRHLQFCSQFGVHAPSHDDLFAVLAGLQNMRVVGVEAGRLDYFARVRSEVPDKELNSVLRNDRRFASVLQNEQ